MSVDKAITTLVDAGKQWGFPAVMVLIMFLGWGWIATKVDERISRQDAKMEATQQFIQTELMSMRADTVSALRECSEALRCNAEAYKDFTNKPVEYRPPARGGTE